MKSRKWFKKKGKTTSDPNIYYLINTLSFEHPIILIFYMYNLLLHPLNVQSQIYHLLSDLALLLNISASLELSF